MESDRISVAGRPPGTELSEVAISDAQPFEGADNPTIIDWEDLQQELARLWSLSSALKKAKERKASLAQHLESIIEVRKRSLCQNNELQEMQQKLEAKRLAMANLSLHIKKTSENVKSEREQLCYASRLLLVAGKTLVAAHQQLQEAIKLLSGERGHGNLKNLQKLLRLRQQHMVSQVSALYPVKGQNEQSSKDMIDSHGDDKSSRDPTASPSASVAKPLHLSCYTILGLQLSILSTKKMSYFSDKKEVQVSASALGYVAHAVTLVASYLDVPIRYPLRFGGSHSYIYDHTSLIETTTSDLMANTALANTALTNTTAKLTEFPLFMEGQDTTRAAYAIFLLNKDLEQLLNYLGAESLGPRHVLPNLKELMRIILSKEFINT